MTGRPRILLLRALGLGDHLTGLPATRAVRRGFPDHEVVLAAPAVLASLVELDDSVDRLLPTEELAPVGWCGRPPEIAVDLHGNGPASRVLLERLGPDRLVAFSGHGPAWRADEHERYRWCRLVRVGLGVRVAPDDLRLQAPRRQSPALDAVVVHVGAGSASRRWPAARYARVAQVLAAEGHSVVLSGSATERPCVDVVRELAGLPPESVLAGRTDLADLAALVAGARLVIAGDTGVGHLASAFATPSVLLFGPTPPARWGPPASGPHTVLWADGALGDPHGDHVDANLARISVADVLGAARQRLPPRPARPSGPGPRSEVAVARQPRAAARGPGPAPRAG